MVPGMKAERVGDVNVWTHSAYDGSKTLLKYKGGKKVLISC